MQQVDDISSAAARAESLSIWQGPVMAERIAGGISNDNFLVRDQGHTYFVRVAGDMPHHLVRRGHELHVARAAAAAGIGPRVVHAEPGVMVLEAIDGTRLTPEALAQPAMLIRIVDLMRQAQSEMPRHFTEHAPFFWPFHVVRMNVRHLRMVGSPHEMRFTGWLAAADALEERLLPISPAYCHNDYMSGNLIDDGRRLWLIDWEHSGFNDPLYDLANLAANNDLGRDAQLHALERFLGRRPQAEDIRRFDLMRAASLLREVVWSAVAEAHATIDFDYAGYTVTFQARLECALAEIGLDLNRPD